MRKLFCVVLCVGVALQGIALAQEKTGDAPEVAELKKQKAELDKQMNELRTKMNARRSTAEKTPDAVELKKTADRARAESDSFPRNDPKLKELAKAREAADREVRAARERAIAASDEGAAIKKERNEIWKNNPILDYQARLHNFILKNKLQPKINAADPDIRSANSKAGGLRYQIDNVRRNLDRNNEELAALRKVKDELKNEHDKVYNSTKPAELKDAWKAYGESEKAYRALYDEKVAADRKAINEARQAENELRTAKKKADDEASKLMAERADLQREKARIEYQLREIDFRMRYGVDGRIGRDPDVQKAANVRSQLEHALRDKENKDPDLVVVRKTRDAARKKAEQLEQAHRKNEALVASWNAYREKEQEYKALYDRLLAEKTADLKPEYEAAQKAANEARAKAYAADPEGKELSEQIAQYHKERNAGRNRDRELQNQWRALGGKMEGNAGVKEARAAAAAARKAYDDAYKASDAPKLRQAADAASRAHGKKVSEILGADEQHQSLNKEYNELRNKARELDRKIRDAGRKKKPAKDKRAKKKD